MPYFPDLNGYLHQSSLLLQAYPSTARITTKYSLPRRPNPKSKTTSNRARRRQHHTSGDAPSTIDPPATHPQREKKDPTATLTLKTFDPTSGICLKYRTDKAAEVGRLMTGLGRLARGEVLDMPAATSATTTAGLGREHEGEAGEKMEIDGPAGRDEKAEATQQQQTGGAGVGQQPSGSRPGSSAGGGGGGGGKGKKKKGKR